MGTEKTVRGVFATILCFAGVFFLISLYIDDYQVYQVLREVNHPGIPQIFPEDTTETISDKLMKYADIVQKRCHELQAEGHYKFKEYGAAADNVNLLVSDHYKLMVCKAPGLAGSNSHRVMYALQNDILDANLIPNTIAKRQVVNLTLNTYSHSEKKYRLQHYKKVMFIRDPLERLLSAYRAGVAQTSQSNTARPSFREYVEHYLSATHPMIPPWQEIWKLCNPCEIKYDYIIPVNSFDTGVAAILQSVGAKNISVPTREQTGYKAKSSQKVMSLFYTDTFPRTVLQQLRHKCKIDYYLFYGEKY